MLHLRAGCHVARDAPFRKESRIREVLKTSISCGHLVEMNKEMMKEEVPGCRCGIREDATFSLTNNVGTLADQWLFSPNAIGRIAQREN